MQGHLDVIVVRGGPAGLSAALTPLLPQRPLFFEKLLLHPDRREAR